MAEVPKPPTTIVKVPSSTSTQGTIPIAPATVMFPVAGPPDDSGLAFIRWNGSWAPRISVTSDPFRPVVWIGPTPPPIDGTYALDDVDLLWLT